MSVCVTQPKGPFSTSSILKDGVQVGVVRGKTGLRGPFYILTAYDGSTWVTGKWKTAQPTKFFNTFQQAEAFARQHWSEK